MITHGAEKMVGSSEAYVLLIWGQRTIDEIDIEVIIFGKA